MNLSSLFRGPRTLFVRLTLIFFAGLVVAQLLAFWATVSERNDAQTSLMLDNFQREVATAVALLDRVPAAERPEWVPRLARRNYSFLLGEGVGGTPPNAKLSEEVSAAIERSIGQRFTIAVNEVPDTKEHLQAHLRLSDGSPLTIDIRPVGWMPLSYWLLVVLAVELVVIAVCAWFALSLATRPLNQLASAADTLGPDMTATRLPEDGPAEVARAAKAFNAMQERIRQYMKERIQILAAISHDLQTPITRMRIRTDLLDDEADRIKFQQDLAEMEVLVREGVAYGRTLHGAAEVPRRIDPDALLESLVSDYEDAGAKVTLSGSIGVPIVTRPVALRRILANLLDNAVKFSGAGELKTYVSNDRQISISVLDRGPGIAQDQLEAVFQPFYRGDASGHQRTGGSGLGLAIAKQLALAMNATLELKNRAGGGLEARLVLEKPF
ncbi:HAMP domain-containing histidine kinase [Paraburkholderia edwinii]|uniref:histidine kinase n=1 Tax=Paraburkholderia edwinii TaxID=2861782 RepID=A0ABX8UZC8_9BURK|nr:HAMP domain-containing sensor histidine kinase [Paraburkholderia edwinii]QYD73642.1 HAMP domain-containing histidine kinase [Paraburkholderia edwinii]